MLLFGLFLLPLLFLASPGGYQLPPSWTRSGLEYLVDESLPLTEDHTLPPLYPYLQWAEEHLPQHDEDAPSPDGRAGAFLVIS